MKRVCLLALAALLLVAVPLAAWLYVPVPTPAYADTISITLFGNIDFGNVTPPVTKWGATDQGDGSPAITITVEPESGNVDIGIKGEITSGNGLDLSNWLYSENFTGGTTGLTIGYVKVYENVTVGDYDFYHWIKVPAGTPAGSHTVNISYKAIATGGTYE